jgi:hypothetical protein
MVVITGKLLLIGAAAAGAGYMVVRRDVQRKLEILPLIMILLILGYIVIAK